MKMLFAMASLLMVLLGVAGAAQPLLLSTNVQPAVAAPGDTVRMQIEFSGKAEEIQDVIVTVREYPNDAPKFQLKPSSKAGKNIWQHKTIVPWDAPTQDFHLDICATDKNGKEIVSKGCEDNYNGRTGTITFRVQ
jgi:hypothetical protein